jgi:hypothetical protein
MNIKVALVVVLFFVPLSAIFAQKTAKSYTIVADPFFYGLINSFSVNVSGVSRDKLSVTAEGPELKSLEKKNGIYYLNLKYCPTDSCSDKYVISVSEKTKQGITLLGPPTIIKVRSLGRPSLIIAGKLDPKELSSAELSSVQTFWVRNKIGKKEINYQILSHELTYSRNLELSFQHVTGAVWSEELRSDMGSLNIGKKIYLDIKYMMPDSNIKMLVRAIKVRK